MTISRPGLARRNGLHKKPSEFDPITLKVVGVHSPDGRLCYEMIHLWDGSKHPRERTFHETFDDLLPIGGIWLRFETEAGAVCEP